MIGLGGASTELQISNAELGRMASLAGMTVGDNGLHDGLVLDGITEGSSDAVGTLTLVATKPNSKVTFSGSASSLNKGLVIQTVGGLGSACADHAKDTILLLPTS